MIPYQHVDGYFDVEMTDRSRGCSDIIFLLAWIAGWIAIAAIFSAAAGAGGNPQK
jgi:hypothetical protein